MTATAEDIHSCSYYCTRPACVLAQRDELRDTNGAGNQVPPTAQPADLIPQDALFVCGQMGAHVTRVLVEAQPAAQPVQPQGWVLVPMEPTPGMVLAGDDWEAAGIYRAMIAARPRDAS